MVDRILKLFHKQFNNIGQAALVLAVFSFVVQLTGLVRDRLLAGQIGPGVELDIYNAAFLIPDLIFALGASLVSVTILMPFLAERVFGQNGEEKSAQGFLDSIFTSFFAAMLIISLIVFVLMPVLAPLVAPGFDPDSLQQLIQTSRIMLLSPIFLGLSNLIGTITQLYKKFFVYALSPALYNVGIVIGIMFFYPAMGVAGLALGVVLGAFLHFLIQLPVIVRQKMVPRLTRNVDWASIWHVMKISIPRTLTLSFNQITLMALFSIASKMVAGTISIFKFALVLQAVPITIIGISYSVAAFPTLVEHFTNGEREKFIESILRPAQQILFWSIPVIVLFIVLRAQIVRVVLGTGQFDWSDTRLVAASLAILVISVAAQGLINLLVRGYYAAGKTMRPLVVNATSSAVTIMLALGFSKIFKAFPEIHLCLDRFMRVTDVGGTQVFALALAYTIGTILNFWILWYFFKRELLPRGRQFISSTIRDITLASLIMGAVAYGGLQAFDGIFNLNSFGGVLAQGFCAGMAGIIVAGSLLYLVKNQEVMWVLGKIKNKVERTKASKI